VARLALGATGLDIEVKQPAASHRSRNAKDVDPLLHQGVGRVDASSTIADGRVFSVVTNNIISSDIDSQPTFALIPTECCLNYAKKPRDRRPTG
jgi:hypothetical protein